MAFKLDSSEMQAKLNALPEKAAPAMLMLLATEAKRVESEMKRKRKWTDRTGQAKARLNTSVSQVSPTMLRMTLAHGVDYGIWLEVAHERKYAIIKPTLQKEAPRVMKSLNGLLDKMAG